MSDPFADISAELQNDAGDDDSSPLARVDPRRANRSGVPEIVYAEGKPDDVVADICHKLLSDVPRVVVSRLTSERIDRISSLLGDHVTIEQPYRSNTIVVVKGCALPPDSCGFVAVLTAGTTDIHAAGEAAIVAREMGCRVEIVADVGVAALHRLVKPLRRVMRNGADVIIVAAGMDGALPSVVTGLVGIPVIGLPTSVGYGVAAGGRAALMTMLSTCSPGMTVVNIDNGVGAGAAAALIARRTRR